MSKNAPKLQRGALEVYEMLLNRNGCVVERRNVLLMFMEDNKLQRNFRIKRMIMLFVFIRKVI